MPSGDPALSGIGWVNWLAEPDYADVTGYAENPYDNPEVSVKQAPDGWAPVADVAGFDATWDLLGDAMNVENLTSNGVAGDLSDLDGAATFGASWKGVHDGSNLYVLLKYLDTNAQADDGSLTFEVMAQPTSVERHEYSFLAAADSTAGPEVVVAYENMSYARLVELGGGKALFANGAVGEYAASVGLNKSYHDGRVYWQAGWGANEHGLLALASATHFWDMTDGVLRAVLVMSFDGALGYPVDYMDLAGDYTAIKVGETLALDIKSNALVGGTEDDNKVEYFWASDANNGYASNYYSGHVTLSADKITPDGYEDDMVSSVKVFVYNNMLHINGVESINVDVYSITGSKMKSVQNVSGQLDISELTDGIYFIKLEGISSGFKVVK